MAMEYRRDIDGLRAVAVLAVVFCHAAVPGFAGGFVGVDVFFAISGYLICGILARELGVGAVLALGVARITLPRWLAEAEPPPFRPIARRCQAIAARNTETTWTAWPLTPLPCAFWRSAPTLTGLSS